MNKRAKSVWTVQEAKARLSEVLRRARAGEAQYIGVDDPCVIVAAQAWQARSAAASSAPAESFGEWLVRTAPPVGPMRLPRRAADRGDPFADDDD